MTEIHPVGLHIDVQEFISSLCAGKSVLDVGCVERSIAREGTPTWLHKHICRTASRAVGLDLLAPEVAELNRRGYNVICGDATSIDVGEHFDVVVAGEIIEHVGNPGALIQNLKRHLNIPMAV